MPVDDSTHLYLNEIRDIPLLTAEEEIALGSRAILGDEAAINELVEHNLKLVVSIAKIYCSSEVTLLDVIQAGNLGLLRAAQKYDPGKINPETKKSYRFSTYAAKWIKQACGIYVEEHSRTIRVPKYILEQVVEIKKAIVYLREKLGRAATIEELVAEVNARRSLLKDYLKSQPITRERIAELFSYADKPLSLDDRGMSRDEYLLGELIEDQQVSEEFENLHDTTMELIEKALAQLNDKQRKVIVRRLGLLGHRKHTLEELVPIVGVTRERVRQIEVGAMKILLSPRTKERLEKAM